MKKEKLSLFGYGKTTKAIASFLGNCCTFFDDNKTKLEIDNLDNKIYPSKEFKSNKFDLEVATPSMSPNNTLIKNAKNLYSEYDFFLSSKSPFMIEPKPFTIWISGTNGKTTTCQMLTHLLKKRGAVSGGNIGTPLAELSSKNSIWVLETSSFTLHHTKYASPNIYLLLPITPDHLDWHGGSKKYIQDKLKPLNTMQEGELALVPKGLNLPKSNAWIVEYEDVEDIERFFNIDASKIKFKGVFLLDAILAMAIDKTLFEELTYTLINKFIPDNHRQEEITDKYGRLWVNDSKATNIDATLQAIKAYNNKFIHLILGGDDKGVDLEDFFKDIRDFNLKIYTIGSNSQKLANLAQKYNIKYHKADILQNALKELNRYHTKDSIALLAPAASSLDQFSSYIQRGNDFKDYIKNL